MASSLAPFWSWVKDSYRLGKFAPIPEDGVPVEDSPSLKPLKSKASQEDGSWDPVFFSLSLLSFCCPLFMLPFYYFSLRGFTPLFKVGYFHQLALFVPLVGCYAISLYHPEPFEQRLGGGLFHHLNFFNVIIYGTTCVLYSVRYSFVEGTLIPSTVEEEDAK